MTILRQKAHDELDLVPEESIEKVFNMIVSFNEKDSEVDYDSIDSAYGMIHQYADINKLPLEEGAFKRAMVKKHETD